MVILDNMVGVILTQFEQGHLRNFEKLSSTIVGDVVALRFHGEGVDKDKGYEYEPEKAEGVGFEVGKEGKAGHLQERLIFGLDLSVKKARSEWGD